MGNFTQRATSQNVDFCFYYYLMYLKLLILFIYKKTRKKNPQIDLIVKILALKEKSLELFILNIYNLHHIY